MIWIKSKSKFQKVWRIFFFVLSESGMLSFFEKQLSRPHGLRGQIVLEGAYMAISNIPIDSSSSDTTTACALPDSVANVDNIPSSGNTNLKTNFKKFVRNSVISFELVTNLNNTSSGTTNLKTNFRKFVENSTPACSDHEYSILIQPIDQSKERRFSFDDLK